MEDIIQLLPEHVANQIAAGEVVQRPASVVKELLENAVDAGAEKIEVVLKDAGKGLIQVADDGRGMSESDLRMAFERHATSKIHESPDLFNIRTMGFRGEALASIAAVARIEAKSRRAESEMASELVIEGNRVISQEYGSGKRGTSVSVKNLFFNVPARRNFLKTNQVEMRHIIDEFERVALARPEITMELVHNNARLFELPASPLRQRIVNVFGKKYNEKLVPVEEKTPAVSVSGFVGKPEFAKKVRGEQFFFVNHRFIKSGYLHHAIQSAFEDLLREGMHPSYFLFLEMDPKSIDINIHPTKTEIKFEDEKTVYAIIRSAVKHGLGQFNIAPSLDFDRDQQFDTGPGTRRDLPSQPQIRVDPSFNPFETESGGGSFPGKDTSPGPGRPKQKMRQEWEKAFEVPGEEGEIEMPPEEGEEKGETSHGTRPFIQIGLKYILTSVKSGLVVIHQQRAHERILYEGYKKAGERQAALSQQLLFPQNINFAPGEFELLRQVMPELRSLGFDIEEFGGKSVAVNGIPYGLKEGDVQHSLQQMLEEARNHSDQLKDQAGEVVRKSLARSASVKTGTTLDSEEMRALVDELFACEMPYSSVHGKPVLIQIEKDELDKRFN